MEHFAPPPSAITDEQLIELIDQFIERSGMKPTRFGIEVMREGGLVASLREGRSLSLKNVNKILSFIAEWKPDSEEGHSASATKSGADIRNDFGLADNLAGNIRDQAQASENEGEADSPGPFSKASPSASSTGEPLNMPADSPSCSNSTSGDGLQGSLPLNSRSKVA